MSSAPDEPESGAPTMLAVLWHQDSLGQVQIIGIFESELDARGVIEDAHGSQAFSDGLYSLAIRPVTKSREGWRLWP